jgi:hypothetical protein
MSTTALALQKSLTDVIAEYDEKVAAAGEVIKVFEAAGTSLKSAATVCGTWGNTSFSTGHVSERDVKGSLLKSAWLHVYNGLNIEQIAPTKDKKLFEQHLLDHPRNSRMPSLLIIGESGIGKTQLDLKFCRDHPARFDEKSRRRCRQHRQTGCST